MLNYNALKQSILIEKPFKFACIQQLLTEQAAEQLRNALPKDHFFRSIREQGSDKTYNVLNNILVNLDQQSPYDQSNMPEVWQTLLQALTSNTYRQHIAELLQEDLTGCYQEITLKVYKPGDFLSFHTDRDQVKATHMIFLNADWDATWGGQLHFAEEKNGVPFARFNPLWLNSVAFSRADNSWHAVSTVTHPRAERIALQAAYWNINRRQILPGRIEEKINVYD